MNRLLARRAASDQHPRGIERKRCAWSLAACGVLALGLATLSVSFGQSPDAPEKVPPGVKTPPPSTLVELFVPAGVKVDMVGTKLTQNSQTGEVVAEGEVMVRLPRHVLLKTYQARVTLPKQVRNKETRVVIEPMAKTLAKR